MELVDVLQSLWALSHALEARSKWMQRNLGVTGPQRLLVRVIGESPGCSPGEAARTLHLNPGTVSRLAAGLEKAGMLKRKAHRGDGRKQVLVLTRRGEAVNGRHQGTVEGAVRGVIGAAGPGELRGFRKFMERLTEELAPGHPGGR